MKKIILAAAVSAAILAPVTLQAEGMISTYALSLVQGGPNVYYTHKLSDTGAVKVGGMSVVGTMIFDVAYKGAIGGELFNGAYFQGGAMVGGVMLPYIGVGYDFAAGSNFVIGGVLNMYVGGGGMILGYDIEVGYKF